MSIKREDLYKAIRSSLKPLKEDLEDIDKRVRAIMSQLDDIESRIIEIKSQLDIIEKSV